MNDLTRQLLETGLSSPSEVAWASVEAQNEARTEAALQEWADERSREDSEKWLPLVEKILHRHGIGHAIRFAAHVEESSSAVREWLLAVCEDLR